VKKAYLSRQKILSFCVLLICMILAAISLPLAELPFDELTLEEKGCLFACPIFQVTVLSDGRVEYKGINYVKVKGVDNAHLSSFDMLRLKSALIRSDFNFPSPERKKECLEVEDGQRILISLRFREQTHTIDNKCPLPEFDKLKATIWHVVGLEKWVGTAAEQKAIADKGLTSLR